MSRYRIKTGRKNPRTCGHCALCLHTNLGCTCNLTDRPVNFDDEACIDFIAEEDDHYIQNKF